MWPFWFSNTQIYCNQNEAHVQNRLAPFKLIVLLHGYLHLAVEDRKIDAVSFGSVYTCVPCAL